MQDAQRVSGVETYSSVVGFARGYIPVGSVVEADA